MQASIKSWFARLYRLKRRFKSLDIFSPSAGNGPPRSCPECYFKFVGKTRRQRRSSASEEHTACRSSIEGRNQASLGCDGSQEGPLADLNNLVPNHGRASS